jgi:hypothetical protein
LNTLIILLDGAADEKIPELGGKTPLESFDKRFIDSIATHGDFGYTDGREYTHLFLLEFFSGKPLREQSEGHVDSYVFTRGDSRRCPPMTPTHAW